MSDERKSIPAGIRWTSERIGPVVEFTAQLTPRWKARIDRPAGDRRRPYTAQIWDDQGNHAECGTFDDLGDAMDACQAAADPDFVPRDRPF